MDGSADRRIGELIAAQLPALLELRHQFHAHPQLGYEEAHAGNLVQEELRRRGIPCQAGLAETGVVGWIVPQDPQAAAREAVGLRAEMDGLPIDERTGLAYASVERQRMHACGHDGHMAILIGAAAVLAEMRWALPCPVKLIFQPAEEQLGGAAGLIEAGALEERVGGVRAGRVFALHGWPELQLGHLATRPGAMFASMNTFRITVTGRGGHGARPHRAADPILAAAHLVTALQSVVSRNVDPISPAVLTVGMFRAGTAENVIPESAVLGGTIRAVDDVTRELIQRRLTEIAERIALALDCQAELTVGVGYPVMMNDPQATSHAMQVARRVLGPSCVLELDAPEMVSEDFALYGQKVPACFCLLGLRPPDSDGYPNLHTPQFDFNDAAIEIGVRVMCRLVLDSFPG